MREKNGIDLEDGLCLSRIDDLIFLSQKTLKPKYSAFLDERQQILISSYIKNADCQYLFWGGYQDSERKMLCVYANEYDKPDYSDFPIKCIEFSYRAIDKLGHRDFLGIMMACQVKRETIGDIVIEEDKGKAKVLVLETIAGFLLSDIKKIGSIGVKTALAENVSIQSERKFSEISGTVSSLRIDSIISLAIKQSRGKVSELIKKSGIEVWYKPTFSVSACLKEGDIFSVRGYGKFILKEVSGVSKKGKLRIIIQKYI